jgi:hypothetical protein
MLLIPALTLFVALAIVMAIPSPSIVSNHFQQFAIVAWNIYPILLYVLHKTLSALIPKAGFLKTTSQRNHVTAIRVTNAFAITASFAVHISVTSISLATVLFPSVFAASYAEELSPRSIFAPPIAIPVSKTAGDGVRSFLLWDQVFGYSVMLLVALLQLQTVVKAKGRAWNWVKVIPMALVGAVIGGPGSACLAVSWARDELLFETGKGEAATDKR